MESGPNSKNKLFLKVVTPEGQFCFIECDSVIFQISDDMNGRGAGSYGVRKGHAKSVFSVCAGNLAAYDDGKTVLSAEIADGFALMDSNTLTVTTEYVRGCAKDEGVS